MVTRRLIASFTLVAMVGACGNAYVDAVTDDATPSPDAAHQVDAGAVCPDGLPCPTCHPPCADGETCVEGACSRCPPGMVICGDVCVDVSTDGEHCGACGVSCEDDRRCVSGVCGCAAGTVECRGACVPAAEAVDCTCPAPTTPCEGACVNTTFSLKHCGECGRECTPPSACLNGECL